METNYKNVQPRSFRDLDAQARAKTLESFQDLIKQTDPITHTSLSEWVSASSDRIPFLKGGVWGGIRWPKGLGRPKTPSITGGFTIVHQFKEIDYVDEGGGHYEDISTFKTQPAPSVWDASSATEFRVGFFFFAGGGGINPNRLTVKLAGVPWDISIFVSPGYLRLDPYGYSDFGNLGEHVVFPDFEVKHEPYRFGPSINPLGPLRDSDLFKRSGG